MEKIYKLTKGDKLTIGRTQYTVKGVLELKQVNFKWKEFLLESASGERIWLNVEPATQEIVQYREMSQEEYQQLEEKNYYTYETGKGTVVQADSIQGVSVGNTVEFSDYTFNENERKRWSYEKWEDEELYLTGQQLSLSDITLTSTRRGLSSAKETSKRDIKYWKALSLGQKLRIRGSEYYIAGTADYKQKQFQWTEYKLEGGKEELWLSVESSTPGKVDFSLFQTISLNQVTFSNQNKKATYQNTTFDCVDAGNGKVGKSSGRVDFDYNEPFSFREYEATNGKLLSWEKWEDETEVSLGETLRESEIEILEGEKKKINNIKPSSVIWGIAGIATILVFVVPWISSLFALPIIDSIKKDSRFSYVTSVTATDNSRKKSHIYETSLSPDQVCRHIIKIDPENIDSIASPNEQGAEEVLLQTKKETVLIYISEDSTTYVQVGKKDTDTGYAPYRAARSYHSMRGFYNTSRYNTYLHQARQESINARKARGGGTSFGK